MNPRISVITVSFNSEKTIEQTIKSVVSQEYDNLEYIIIDGASTDGTLDIIRKYAEAYPDIILYKSEKDNGIYDAMNKGIEMSTGDIVGIINSDDYYEKEAVPIVSRVYNECYMKDQIFVIYGMTRFLKDDDVEDSVVMVSHNSLPVKMMCHPACFVSKEAYKKIGLFNCNYKSAADYDLFLRLFLSKKVSFYPVYEVLANFRLGGMSSSEISYSETADIKKKYSLISNNRYVMLKITNIIKRKLFSYCK